MDLRFKYNSFLRNKKYFFLIGIFWALLITYLNWNNKTMLGLVDYYNEFANLISSNFNLNKEEITTSTFPMWGYGFILNLSNSKLFIVGMQLILFFLFLAFSLSSKIRKLFKINNSPLPTILLFLPSYIAIFSTMTPNSLAIFFMTFSIIFFALGFDNLIKDQQLKTKNLFFRRSFLIIILSGLFAGITMNFRSDYTLFFLSMPIFSIIIFLKWINSKYLIKHFFKKILAMVIAFYFSIFTIMTPWMNYTSKYFNKRLITSSNTGHVFFIGLGQLPNNKWNITTSDNDHVKSLILKNNGIDGSLTIEGDTFLKKEYLKLILKSPFEYFKKVCLSFVRVAFGGIYIPEFFEISSCDMPNKTSCRDLAKTIAKGKIQNLFKLNLNYFLRISLTTVSFLASAAIVLTGFVLLPKFIYEAWIYRSLVLIFPALAIIYQALIGVFAFHMPLYMTNVYLFFVIVISFSFSKNSITAKYN